MLAKHLAVRHIVRHLAQRVHVVGEADQPRPGAGERLEGAAHHARARHLAEGADMRQAGGAVAGGKDHLAAMPAGFLHAGDQLACLLERPSL